MEYLTGAAAGLGASRLNKYIRTLDPDRGARFFKSRTRMRRYRRGQTYKPTSAAARIIQTQFRARRYGKTNVIRKTQRNSNGGKKRSNYRPKAKTVKFGKRVNRSILYPNKSATTVFVGQISHTQGTTPNLQLGNMKYLPLNESQDVNHSAYMVIRCTSLGGNSVEANLQGAGKLQIGQFELAGSSVNEDIKDGTNKSKILVNQTRSSTAVETLTHYVKNTGLPNLRVNPNHICSGVSINLQFLPCRPVDQTICVRLVRVKYEALEDKWGQSKTGSDSLSYQNVANMVNSQNHINKEVYEIIYQCKTNLRGWQPGSKFPRAVKIKKYIPLNYMLTQAKRQWSANDQDFGANLKPTYEIEDGYFNQIYCVITVKPNQSQIPVYYDNASTGGLTNLTLINRIPAQTPSSTASDGILGNAMASINGIVKTYYQSQNCLRTNETFSD